jgi:hypothetical protein
MPLRGGIFQAALRLNTMRDLGAVSQIELQRSILIDCFVMRAPRCFA